MTLPDAATLVRLRSICLALPEAIEKTTWEAPTFRIRDKIFAMVHATDGRPSVWCKAPPGVQTVLLEAAPERFFRPPYVGPKGWVGIWLDVAPDWPELTELIGRSYRMTAPKRLLGQVSADRSAGDAAGPLSNRAIGPAAAMALSNPADIPAEPSRRKSPRAHHMRRRKPGVSMR